MKRLIITLCVLLVTALLHTRAAAASKPNIIFILADDLGYGDLGCYGQKQIKTPSIDRMAQEGMRFTQHYAASTVCAPSRCGLMTGLHMGHARVRGNAGVCLRPGDVTVAEVLKQAGYSTALIGKWGLGNQKTAGHPNKQGFDYFFGYLDQGHAHDYYTKRLFRNEKVYPLSGRLYTHDLFTSEALSYIRRQKNGPFFLYLAYTIPHANNELGRETGNGMQVPSYKPYQNEPWPDPEKGRAAMITRMDRDIGRIFNELKALGIDDDTIVFFSSDNGPHKEGGSSPEFFDSNGPLRGIKRDLYEGGIRVPFIARWPGKVRPGTNDHISAFCDFLPTAAQIAGINPPRGVDGISMLPALTGKKQKEHDYLYWEWNEKGQFHQAVRMGDWKAVKRGPKAPIEIYNLKTDPGETTDVSTDCPNIIKNMQSVMTGARSDSDEFPVPRE